MQVSQVLFLAYSHYPVCRVNNLKILVDVLCTLNSSIVYNYDYYLKNKVIFIFFSYLCMYLDLKVLLLVYTLFSSVSMQKTTIKTSRSLLTLSFWF